MADEKFRLERHLTVIMRLGESPAPSVDFEKVKKAADELGRTAVDYQMKKSDAIVGTVNALLGVVDILGIDPKDITDPNTVRKALIEKFGVESVPIATIPEDIADKTMRELHWDLHLDSRPHNILVGRNVVTAGAIGSQSIRTLGEMGMGPKSIDSVKGLLAWGGYLIPELMPPTAAR